MCFLQFFPFPEGEKIGPHTHCCHRFSKKQQQEMQFGHPKGDGPGHTSSNNKQTTAAVGVLWFIKFMIISFCRRCCGQNENVLWGEIENKKCQLRWETAASSWGRHLAVRVCFGEKLLIYFLRFLNCSTTVLFIIKRVRK